jgi:hypothetical protein
MRLTQMDSDSFVLGHFGVAKIARERDLPHASHIENAHDPGRSKFRLIMRREK